MKNANSPIQGKIKKFLKGLSYLVKNPRMMNSVLEQSSYWQNYVEKKHGLGYGLPTIELDQLLPNFSETLQTYGFLDGSSLPTDISLLKGLARTFRQCRYFEIGTWRGESVSNVADVAEICYTLNLSEEEMRALGLSESYIELHGFFSKNKANVHHLEGNSLTYDFGKFGQKIDLIFIDGDHQYQFVKNDTAKTFRHLTHDNSVVVWHDYAFHPEQIRFEVLAGILDGLPDKNLMKNLFHVSNTMCAVYIKKDFPGNRFLTYPVVPSRKFWVEIKSQKL